MNGPSCPRCALALVDATTVGNLGVQSCSGCGGVFADRAAVAELRSGSVGPSHVHVLPDHRVDTSGQVKCPVCDEVMTRVNFGRNSGVIVDVCVEHGTWFDAEEIDRVASFIASGGLSRADGRTPHLSAEDRHKLGELQAQVIQERYDDMHRVERTTWFTRFGIRTLFDWIT